MAGYAIPAWVKHVPGSDFVEFEAISKTGMDFHVDAGTNPSPLQVKACVACLAGAVFDNEHPGQISALAMRQVEAAIGRKPLSDADKAMIARQEELGMTGPRP